MNVLNCLPSRRETYDVTEELLAFYDFPAKAGTPPLDDTGWHAVMFKLMR